jgi:hypothetical protein
MQLSNGGKHRLEEACDDEGQQKAKRTRHESSEVQSDEAQQQGTLLNTSEALVDVLLSPDQLKLEEEEEQNGECNTLTTAEVTWDMSTTHAQSGQQTDAEPSNPSEDEAWNAMKTEVQQRIKRENILKEQVQRKKLLHSHR